MSSASAANNSFHGPNHFHHHGGGSFGSWQPALCLAPVGGHDTNSTSAFTTVAGKLPLVVVLNGFGRGCDSNDVAGAVINLPAGTPVGTVSFSGTSPTISPLFGSSTIFVSGIDSTSKHFFGSVPVSSSGNQATFNLLNLNKNGTATGVNATPGATITSLYIAGSVGFCGTIYIDNLVVNGKHVNKKILTQVICPLDFL